MSIIEDDDNKKRIDKYIDENECKQKDYERIFVRGEKKILSVYRLPTEFLYLGKGSQGSSRLTGMLLMETDVWQ